jgi:hypothetical protein
MKTISNRLDTAITLLDSTTDFATQNVRLQAKLAEVEGKMSK